MKGINLSISLIITLVVGVAVILIIGSMLSSNIAGIEIFGDQNLDLFVPGEQE